MVHILSVDYEDWHQLAYRRVTGRVPPVSPHLDRQTDLLLELLDAAGVKATFFTLGMAAEARPQQVKRMAAAGHEIASHGYAHLIVHRVTREQFRADTLRSKELLEDLTGQPVRGYRAAEFSIGRESLWALEELAVLGFHYDSSIVPMQHRRYGIPEFHPAPARYRLPGGGGIAELPLTIRRFGPVALPAAGGGYFRLLPAQTLRKGLQAADSRGQAVVTYFHPYEFDDGGLDVFSEQPPRDWRERLAGWRFNLHQNLGRGSTIGKLGRILREMRFSTCAAFLERTELSERSALLGTPGRAV